MAVLCGMPTIQHSATSNRWLPWANPSSCMSKSWCAFVSSFLIKGYSRLFKSCVAYLTKNFGWLLWHHRWSALISAEHRWSSLINADHRMLIIACWSSLIIADHRMLIIACWSSLINADHRMLIIACWSSLIIADHRMLIIACWSSLIIADQNNSRNNLIMHYVC